MISFIASIFFILRNYEICILKFPIYIFEMNVTFIRKNVARRRKINYEIENSIKFSVFGAIIISVLQKKKVLHITSPLYEAF